MTVDNPQTREDVRDAAITACRITGWDGVAKRLEQGWTPEPGTREADLLDLFARHSALSTVNVDALREALERIDAIATDAPEINMSNFDQDDVSGLNEAMIEVFHIARAALSTKAPLSMEGLEG
jgi:hypothetical protein